MTAITLENPAANALKSAEMIVEVKDTSGELIGYFAKHTKDGDPHAAARLAQKIYGLPDPEEVRRLAAQNERVYTTAEVLDYLKTLEKAA